MWLDRRHHRQPGLLQAAPWSWRAWRLMQARARLDLFQAGDADVGARSGGDRRRQGGGEDEPGGIGTAPRRMSACRSRRCSRRVHAEGLGQRAFDHRRSGRHQARRARRCRRRRSAVEADGMDLVEIGHGAIAFGQVADLRRSARCRRPWNRPTRSAISFGRDRLGLLQSRASRWSTSLCRKMHFSATAAADAVDHGGVVEGVRQDQAVRQQAGDGADGRRRWRQSRT